MSVDGRTAPVMNSVRQLVDVFPHRCLVRKTIDAMTIDDVRQSRDSGKSRVDEGGTRSRRVCRGELLTLVHLTATQRLLQCRDEKDRVVYLPLNQRGLFSAVNAGQTAASVYKLSSLLTEFRLPIVVRLVHGSLPVRDATTTDLRLVGIQTDHVTFVLPLRHAWASNNVVDQRAMVAVPSKHASRLTVADAAPDFYRHWAMSDAALELNRRCAEIVAAWKLDVHVVSSSIAAAAAAAAATEAIALTGAPRGYDGDYVTWSRGPMISSVDSGLASSIGSPSAPFLATDTPYNDDHHHDEDDVEHLEREIDEIYAMIRYGADGVARLYHRARSLDNCVSGGVGGGEVFAKKVKHEVHNARRPSADVPRRCVQKPTTTMTLRLVRRDEPVGRFYEVARSSSEERRLSCEQDDVDNVQLLGMSFRSESEIDNDDDPLWLDRDDSQEVATSAECPLEARAVVTGRQPSEHRVTSATTNNCDGVEQPTSKPSAARRRSKSLPEVTCLPSCRHHRDGSEKPHKSVVGTFTRSIANVFRRMRPHKEPRVYTLDRSLATYASERYRRKTYDYGQTREDILGD